MGRRNAARLPGSPEAGRAGGGLQALRANRDRPGRLFPLRGHGAGAARHPGREVRSRGSCPGATRNRAPLGVGAPSAGGAGASGGPGPGHPRGPRPLGCHPLRGLGGAPGERAWPRRGDGERRLGGPRRLRAPAEPGLGLSPQPRPGALAIVSSGGSRPSPPRRVGEQISCFGWQRCTRILRNGCGGVSNPTSNCTGAGKGSAAIPLGLAASPGLNIASGGAKKKSPVFPVWFFLLFTNNLNPRL